MDDLLLLLMRLLHVTATLGTVLLIALAGRAVARALRQPPVIGEIAGGLLAGPGALHLLGRETFDALLPGPVSDWLRLIAEAGLVLYLVGLAHHLRTGPGRPDRRSTLWVAAGSLVPPLLAGGLLAGWILLSGDGAARGDAPLPAFLLLTGVSMAITAVPVLARILAERGMAADAAGRLALSSAIVIDAVGWLLLTVALSLGAGDMAGTLGSLRALLAGALGALALRGALRTRAASALAARAPRSAAALLGGFALGLAFAMQHFGMTAILGGVLAGLAVPDDRRGPWNGAVTAVSRTGRRLVPAFFVVAGITVLEGAFSATSWQLPVVACALGCLGKLLGGYAGARLAGRARGQAYRIGILMNTRGLTELIVLQAGFSAGILSAPLGLALVVMALTTTAMTGPLLGLADRAERRAGAALVPLETESSPR